jgi:hypothetical protein
MRVPGICGRARAAARRWRWSFALRALGVCALVAGPVGADAAEKKPWLQLPLESLGFPGASSALVATGASLLTVNFVDSSHLLVTYSLRKLVPRLENDPEDHDDRLVAGEIIDLPSGQVEARTEWHMHDHGRYLWALGGGRFLVRIGERMYLMAPLEHMGAKDPFVRTVFPSPPVRPNLVEVSPDGGVVTLETVFTESEQGSTKVLLGDQDSAPVPTSRTVIEFFRVQDDGTGVRAEEAGGVQSPGPIFLPIDADGYLWARDTGAGAWAVTFDGFGGKSVNLGKIMSSCQPRLQMTSRSEYMALTCQGSDDRIKMTSYGLDGLETWEEVVGDFERPSFAFAEAAARFAVSAMGSDEVRPDDPASGPRQEVRVYQNASGELLLRVECMPAYKTAENFDLSGDGMLAAVVRDGVIAVYQLPPLSKRDKEDMTEVAAYAPPASTAKVALTRITGPVKAPRRAVEDGSAASTLGAPPESSEVVGSNGQPPRRRPTLLNPGEKPEFGTANVQPE